MEIQTFTLMTRNALILILVSGINLTHCSNSCSFTHMNAFI